MSYLICIFACVMLWVVWKRPALKKWWLVAALAAIAACMFANTPLGGQCAGGIRSVLGALSGGNAAIAATLVAVVLSVIVGCDIGKDHKTDRPALFCLALLPMLFAIAAGPVGTGGVMVSDAIANIGTNGLNWLGG